MATAPAVGQLGNYFLDASQVQWINSSGLSMTDLGLLDQYYASLPSGQRQSWFDQLVSNPKNATQVVASIQDPLSGKLRPASAGVVSPANPTPPPYSTAPGGTPSSKPSPPPDPSTPAGRQEKAVSAAQTNVGMLSESGLGGETSAMQAAPSVAVPGSAAQGQLGFGDLLQQYNAAQYTAAGEDVNALAELAGTDPPTLQQQYQSYTQGWAKASQMGFKPGITKEFGGPPMSLGEFAQQQGQTLMGSWSAVMGIIGNVYQSQTGSPMPADLQRQILTALQQMPANQQSNVLYNAYQYMQSYQSAKAGKSLVDQQGTYQAAVLQGLPSSVLTYSAGTGPGTGAFGTSGIMGSYMQLHPSQLLQTSATDTMISNAFQQALGRAPNSDELAALGAQPSPQQVSDYINTLPMPGYPGMTYGQYQAVSKNMTTLWQNSFGKSPTQQELMWGVGKSQSQLQDFVNNSPSQIPGVTIGRYNDLTNFISSTATSGATTHAFSAGVDDSLVQSLHNQLQSASTQQPKPGPMGPASP